VQSEDRTQLTEFGSTGRHYLVFKDQKNPTSFIPCPPVILGAASRLV
jgi:hypothetical protein